jgi:hypothetical protein
MLGRLTTVRGYVKYPSLTLRTSSTAAAGASP